MLEGVILSGGNLVPQGNNLSNGIRERTKERGRGKLPISGETRKAFEKRVCCVGSFNSRSFAQPEFLSVVSDRVASRCLCLHTSKVLCRKISLLVLSARVAKCCVGSSRW